MFKNLETQILILGAGPAGLAAAIYTARAGKKTIVLKGKTKSHLELAHKVENYPGIASISGPELLQKMEEQAISFGAEILERDALELGLGFDPKMVTTRQEVISTKAIILAMGKGEHKKTILNESSFIGLGVSYCSTCDGAFFRGRNVVVYGNDHEAIDDALMLKQLGCNTTLITYCGKNNCPPDLMQTAKEKGLTIIENTEIIEVKGESTLKKIVIRNSDGEKELETDGLFIIQEVPSATLLQKAGVTLTNKDCIAIDRKGTTNIPGVFAAGDITCGGLQIITAAGEGANAALETLKYLRNS